MQVTDGNPLDIHRKRPTMDSNSSDPANITDNSPAEDMEINSLEDSSPPRADVESLLADSDTSDITDIPQPVADSLSEILHSAQDISGNLRCLVTIAVIWKW